MDEFVGYDWSPHRKKHKLEEGDVVCLYCEGTGIYPPSKIVGYGLKNCEKCDGDGYFDWVEVVVGKSRPYYFGYSGYEKIIF